MCTKCDQIHRWLSYATEIMNSGMEDTARCASRLHDELVCALQATKDTYHYESVRSDGSDDLHR